MGRFAIGLVILLAACTETVIDEALSVCAPLCRCDSPLPGEQRECTNVCVTQFANNPPPPACSACLVAHATRCSTVLDDCLQPCRELGRSFLEDAFASGIEETR